MNTAMLIDAQVQEKRFNSLLNEVMDVSQQLMESIDRGDEVTVKMLLAMRAEPVEKLQETRRAIEEQRCELPPADAQRLTELLDGAKAERQEEVALVNQVGANDRLLKKVIEMDKILSNKLARKESIYARKK
jgi:hypothetical protein